MRLFVAVNLPESVCVDLHAATIALRQAAPTARWVHPDMLHITLKYLGHVSDEVLPQVREQLERAARAGIPFDLQIRGFGAFPAMRHPRVLWVGTAPSAPLEWLQSAVEREITPLGFEPDARPFQPHITLARVRVALPPEESAALEQEAAGWAYQVSAQIRSVELMESTPSPKGSRYVAIKSVPLGDRPEEK